MYSRVSDGGKLIIKYPFFVGIKGNEWEGDSKMLQESCRQVYPLGSFFFFGFVRQRKEKREKRSQENEEL